jgi:uncharacterized membrane protein (DUF106 family)
MTSVLPVISALPWFAWVAIVAIVSGTISSIFKMLITHKERMTMIQHGMHPDVPASKPREEAEV